MPLTERAEGLVADAMADIRAIDDAGIDRDGVEAIRDRLIALAKNTDEFTSEHFPPPGDGDDANSAMYRISEDDDHRFALYVMSCGDHTATPPHDHTTWAVIAGIDGQERNIRYAGLAEGGAPEAASELVVEQGTGIAFLPDDVHSIHIEGGAINFHCYGRGLEQLDARNYWSESTGEWKVFAAMSDIREGRREGSR